jgi:hypothetical protein
MLLEPPGPSPWGPGSEQHLELASMPAVRPRPNLQPYEPPLPMYRLTDKAPLTKQRTNEQTLGLVQGHNLVSKSVSHPSLNNESSCAAFAKKCGCVRMYAGAQVSSKDCHLRMLCSDAISSGLKHTWLVRGFASTSPGVAPPCPMTPALTRSAMIVSAVACNVTGGPNTRPSKLER